MSVKSATNVQERPKHKKPDSSAAKGLIPAIRNNIRKPENLKPKPSVNRPPVNDKVTQRKVDNIPSHS